MLPSSRRPEPASPRSRAVAGALLVALGGCGAGDGAPAIVLVDVTARAGLPAASQMCLVFDDFDRDGRADLLLAPVDAQGQLDGRIALYRNRDGRSFEEHSIPVPLLGVRHCAAADFDGDGFLDVAIAGWRAGMQGPTGAVVLLRNAGAPGLDFVDVSERLPILDDPDPRFLGFFDYDRDGWLDLYVGFFIGGRALADHCDVTDADFQCYLAAPVAPRPATLLRNLDGQRFEPATVWPQEPHYNLTAAFFDWDGDGYLDLFQSNDWGQNAFYRNLRGAGFSDLLAGWNANPYNHGMGVAFGDFDRDGRWDFYAVDAGPDQLWFGRSDGAVENRAAKLGIADATRFHSGWSPIADDFNNDGQLDLYVVNAGVGKDSDQLAHFFGGDEASKLPPQDQVDFLFTGRPGGDGFDFSTVPQRTPKRPDPASAGTAVADFDGDGWLDLAVVVATDALELRLLHNEGASPERHALTVRLTGAAPNGGALGALVTLREGGRDLDRRAVGVAGGLGVSTGTVHFGLGARTAVDGLSVRWPDGMVQEVPGPIPADRPLEVRRP